MSNAIFQPVVDQLDCELSRIISGSLFAPAVTMNRMLSMVSRLNADSGFDFRHSRLFDDGLIDHLRRCGQTVDNRHRITLTIGNANDLSLRMLVEAPGHQQHIRFILSYTDGTETIESHVGYGSAALTAERFDSIVASFNARREDVLSRVAPVVGERWHRLMERRLFESALPIFVREALEPLGLRYELILRAAEYPDGGVLRLSLPRYRIVSVRLSPDRFEQQLARLPQLVEAIDAVDSATEIVTSKQMRLQFDIFDAGAAGAYGAQSNRQCLPGDAAGSHLRAALGDDCVRILTPYEGVAARAYLMLRPDLWLSAPLGAEADRQSQEHLLAERHLVMTLYDRFDTLFTLSRDSSRERTR